METDYKKEDTAKIAAYLHNRHDEEVLVEDIMLNSGAEKLRVYPILFELEQEGRIEVAEREELGAPKGVRLKP